MKYECGGNVDENGAEDETEKRDWTRGAGRSGDSKLRRGGERRERPERTLRSREGNSGEKGEERPKETLRAAIVHR